MSSGSQIASLDVSLLVKLLNASQEAEGVLRTALRQTMGYYSTILVAVIGGTLAGLRAVQDLRVLAVFIAVAGGVIVALMAIAAFIHFRADFTRQIELMSIQAKYEELLGLADPKRLHAASYWTEEPIVPRSYMRGRTFCANTDEFTRMMLKGRGSKAIAAYYMAFLVIGLALVLLGILIATGSVALPSTSLHHV